MLLVDTSVWVDHLRKRDEALVSLLGSGEVVLHPFVIGELACGNVPNRQHLLSLLSDMPMLALVAHSEVLNYIEQQQLFGIGIGWVDVHLLSSTARTDECRLWTRDKRLHRQAKRLNLAKEG